MLLILCCLPVLHAQLYETTTRVLRAETLKNAKRKLERPVAPVMPCKRKAQTGTTKVAAKHGIASPKRFQQRFMVAQWNLMNPQCKEWNLLYFQNTKITLRTKVHFDHPLQFGAHAYSDATSDENSGCKSCSAQGMGKIGENFGVEPDESQKQERGDR